MKLSNREIEVLNFLRAYSSGAWSAHQIAMHFGGKVKKVEEVCRSLVGKGCAMRLGNDAAPTYKYKELTW